MISIYTAINIDTVQTIHSVVCQPFSGIQYLFVVFYQAQFRLTAPKGGGEMFECKSRSEMRMMAIPTFDETKLLTNGNQLLTMFSFNIAASK